MGEVSGMKDWGVPERPVREGEDGLLCEGHMTTLQQQGDCGDEAEGHALEKVEEEEKRDRGDVPAEGQARVGEPGQRAVQHWRLQHEIST